MVSFIRIVKTTVDAFVRIVAGALFVLGLWLPGLFFLVFVVTCAATGTSLSAVIPELIVGLIISAIAGIAVSYIIEQKKRENAQVVRNDRIRKEIEHRPKEIEKNQPAPTAPQPQPVPQNQIQPPPVPQTQIPPPPPLPQNPPPQNCGYECSCRCCERAGRRPPWNCSGFVGENQNVPQQQCAEQRQYAEPHQNSEPRSGYGENRADIARQEVWKEARDDERPLVFRSRRGKDIYVYEYSDRLEYYKRTFFGMKLLEIHRKK